MRIKLTVTHAFQSASTEIDDALEMSNIYLAAEVRDLIHRCMTGAAASRAHVPIMDPKEKEFTIERLKTYRDRPPERVPMDVPHESIGMMDKPLDPPLPPYPLLRCPHCQAIFSDHDIHICSNRRTGGSTC